MPFPELEDIFVDLHSVMLFRVKLNQIFPFQPRKPRQDWSLPHVGVSALANAGPHSRANWPFRFGARKPGPTRQSPVLRFHSLPRLVPKDTGVDGLPTPVSGKWHHTLGGAVADGLCYCYVPPRMLAVSGAPPWSHTGSLRTARGPPLQWGLRAWSFFRPQPSCR